jgi:hypothetical protein
MLMGEFLHFFQFGRVSTMGASKLFTGKMLAVLRLEGANLLDRR